GEGIQLGHHLLRRVDARVVADRLVHQRGGRLVGVGELHVVGDFRNDFRTQQEVQVGVGVVDVLRIGGNGQHVEEGARALLGNAVLDVHPGAGFLGARLGLVQVAGIAHGHADVAVGQVGNVLGGVEV